MNPILVSSIRKVCAVTILLLPMLGSKAHGQTLYNLARIDNPDLIRPSGLGSGSPAPSLNASGRVAFGGSDINLRFGIFSGDGSESEVSEYLAMAINPAVKPVAIGSYVGARVAFSGSVNSKDGIYNSDGVNTETIVQDASINNGQFRRPLMNNSRQFPYFHRDDVKSEFGLSIAQNNSSNVVYKLDSFTRRGVLQFRGVFDSDAAPIVISDAGDLYFVGVFSCLQNNPPQPNDCQDEVEGIIKGNGGPPTLLVRDGTIDAAGTHVSIDSLAVSSSGSLAYVASISDDAGSYYRLYNGTSPVTDTRAGPFSFLGEVAVNNGGSIVFQAEYRDSAGKLHEGLFNGPDLVRNKILAIGDPLFGSTVVGFSWSPLGFNNSGQVAFFANLATGKSAIVRADPGDGSTQVEWIGPGGGSATGIGAPATEPANWKPLNGDPPRVPTKTTAISDTALFDRAGEYAIALGDQHAERLVVKNGHVTFKTGDITVDALSFEVPSAEIDNARLTLSTLSVSSDLVPLATTVTCNHALIGGFAAARVDVVDNSQWLAHGSLRVGGPGEGILTIGSHGEVSSGEARIGAGPGGGKATVDQAGSWTTGNIAIGAGGKGELTITAGGQVRSGGAVIGQAAESGGGLGNAVLVQGTSETSPSHWNVDVLNVGDAVMGRLDVKGGGFVETVVTHIAQKPGVTGLVTVTGVDPSSPTPSKLFAGDLFMGEGGFSSLRIEDGGLVQALHVHLGDLVGDSIVTVTGIHTPGGLPSKLDVAETLFVGNSSSATFLIEDGGIVHSKNGKVFGSISAPPETSEVTVRGSASLWSIDEELTVGSEGSTGAALVTLVSGKVQAASVEVNRGGKIQGNGVLAVPDRVINTGGTISPGLSPGVLTIDGQYEQRAEGRLLIEIGGTNAADGDHLVITKAATLDGTLELRFVNGLAPKQGDTFNFLQVGGNLTNGFSSVEIKNLAPDFQFNVSTNGTNLSLVALNDGVFVAPLQGQISSSNVLTIGGISYLPYHLQLTNDCSGVEFKGGLQRQGQEISQVLSEQSDPACRESSADVSGILPLGALSPGDYQFHFIADGVVVHTASFTVRANADQVLTLTRTSPQELKLQINGLAGVVYTIESSTDLIHWVTAPAHVGKFRGPYSILEPLSAANAVFYRVKIE